MQYVNQYLTPGSDERAIFSPNDVVSPKNDHWVGGREAVVVDPIRLSFVPQMDSPSEEAPSPTPRKLSCTVCFDALWFCYSPVHQMQQYYRLGTLDNCTNKWSALYDCLSLKTKRSSEVQEILEARERAKPHIWTFRTPEEASAHWNRLFGHLQKKK